MTLNIDEGQPRPRRGRSSTSASTRCRRRASDQFKSRLPLQPNAPLDRALAQATREAALDEVKDHGYPYATVRLTDRAGSNDHSRILTLTATPGTLAHYGDTEVSATTRVGDQRSSSGSCSSGQARRYRLSQIQESQRRLYDLETFQFAQRRARREGRAAARRSSRSRSR